MMNNSEKEEVVINADSSIDSEDISNNGTLQRSVSKYGTESTSYVATKPRQYWGARYTLGLMANLGLSINYMLITGFSVAIVSMVGTAPDSSIQNLSDVCPLPDNYTSDTPQYIDGAFDWTEATQGLILGSFYYGYAASQIPLGRAAEVYGGRLVFGGGVIVSSVLELLAPVCATTSTGLFVAVRVLQGLALGGTFPSINSLITTWFPPVERSKLTTLLMTGSNIGIVVGMPLTGWLCGSGVLGGWPLSFYVHGSLGLVWSLVWFLTVHDRPERHPTITEEELRFIQSEGTNMKQQETFPVPWLAILLCPWIWIVIISGVGDEFGFYIIITMLPTYLANIQHFDIKKIGALSGLPYLVAWIISVIWGFLIGFVATSKLLSTKRIRQLSMGVACYTPALCLLGMCFVNCNSTLAVVVLCLAVAFTPLIFSGYMCSHQDLAPNFAGTLMGITNTINSIMGVVSPLLVGMILNNNQTLSGWRVVFLLTSVVYVGVASLFIAFTPVTLQPWNTPPTPPQHSVMYQPTPSPDLEHSTSDNINTAPVTTLTQHQ